MDCGNRSTRIVACHAGSLRRKAAGGSLIAAAAALGLPVDGAHSRVRFGVTLERPWRVFFVTMFPPIVLVMMCCWFIFFLRPIHVEARDLDLNIRRNP